MTKLSHQIMAFLLCFSSFIQAQILIDENFDDGIPNDWSQTTNADDGGWLHGDALDLRSEFWELEDPQDGSRFIATNDDGCNCDKGAEFLNLPAVNLASASEYAYMEVEYAFQQGTYEGATEEFRLLVSMDAGSNWETVYEFDGDGEDISWRKANIDLSDYTGYDEVYFSFFYSDDDGWTWGAALNQVTLVHAKNYDISLHLSEDVQKFYEKGKEVEIDAYVINKGARQIDRIDLSMTTLTDTYQMILEEIMERQDTVWFTFPNTLQISEESEFVVEFRVEELNGSFSDEFEDNSRVEVEFVGVVNPPLKRIFLEQLVGTWCDRCPQSYHFVEYIRDNQPDLATIVNVHIGIEDWADPMELYDYTDFFELQKNRLPRTSIDRQIINNGTEPYMYGEGLAYLKDWRDKRTAPFGIEVLAVSDGMSPELDIQVDIEAHCSLSNEDLRVILLATEDGVTGDAFEYRQANGFAAYEDYEEIAPWTVLDDPVPGDQLVFDQVLIQSYTNDPTGIVGIIPPDVELGDHYKFGASLTVPEGKQMDDFTFIVAVLDHHTGEVLNSSMNQGITIVSSTDGFPELEGIRVFENNLNEEINILVNQDLSLEFTLVDGYGQVLIQRFITLKEGETARIGHGDLPTGIYSCKISQKGRLHVSKLFIN